MLLDDLHHHASSLGCHYVKSVANVNRCPDLHTSECTALTESGTPCKDLENVDLSFTYTTPMRFLDAAGWGLDFPAMRNGREDAGFGVGMDDPFFLESVEEPPCSSCKDSFSSGNKKSIPSFPGGMVSSFLTFVMLTLMSQSCSEIKSNHCSFQGNDFSFQPYSSLTVGTNLGFVFLPVKHLVLQLKRFGAHPEVLSKVSSDVLGWTSLLELLLG